MTQHLRTTVLALATLGTLALTAACGGVKSSTDAGGDLVVGTSLSLTGPLGAFGVDLKQGYQQAVDEVNKAGGLKVGGVERTVVLKVLDNRSDPNVATQQVRELALKDSAVAVLGGCTPPIVVPEALAAEKAKVPFVSSCNPVLAFQGGNKDGWTYAWDLFFDEKDQAATAAEGLAKDTEGNKKVALFTDTEPDGVAERGLYKAAFAAAGLDVVGDYTFPVGTSDYSSFVNDAKAKGAELVAGQMIPPDGIALWKQMKSLNFKPRLTFLSKGATNQTWPDALGPIAEGSLSEGFWSPTNGYAGSTELQAALGPDFAKSPADLGIAALGYTVAKVVTDAITSAGSTNPSKVNDAIGSTDKEYPLGKLAFGASTHTATTPYLLTQWQNGTLVPVLPDPAPGVTLEVPGQGLS